MMNLKFTSSRKINRTAFLTGFLWIILACVLVGAGPFGMLYNESVSKSVADDNRKTDSVTEELPIIVEFVPQHDFISSIGFVLNRGGGEAVDGRVWFKVFDGALQLISETMLPMESIEDGGFTDVELNLPVKAGETYFYRIEMAELGGAAPRLEYRSLSGCGPLENRTLYYGSTVMEDSAPVSRYVYRLALEAEQFLAYAAFLVFLGLLGMAGIRKQGRKKQAAAGEGAQESRGKGSPEQDRLRGMGDSGIRMNIRWLGCLLAGIGVAWFWDFLIVENRFRTAAFDHAVYGAGLLLLLFLLWFGCWRVDFGALKRALLRWDRKKAAAAFRILMFAGVCLGSVYYYNSGSNYGHRIATRFSMSCFGLAVLAFYAWRQVIHKWSILYAVLACAAAGAYAAAVPMEAKELLQFALSALVVVIWGLVALRLFGNWREKRVRRLAPGYSLLLFGFFALLILFRNTRTWPFEIAFYFTLLYLQDFTTGEWRLLLRDFCSGLLLSFAVILGFSLLFRPYHRYNYSRYPMAFYSVATCALYLTAVFCAALTKLLAAWRRQPGVLRNIGPLFVMSVVFCYTFMTISRTAYMALAAAGVCLAIVLCLTWYKGRKRTVAALACLVLGCGFLTLPLVFTATRTIPALVGNPYIMDAEYARESILPGYPIDSRWYMNAERFYELTFEKLGDTFRVLEEPEGGSASAVIPETGGIGADAAYISYSFDVAAAKDYVGLGGINDKAETAGNGRGDIFRAYIRELNLTGHETMVVENETETFYHAHNTFLQTAYDHGIPTGIYFVFLGILCFFRSIQCVKADGDENEYLIFAVMIVAAFGTASLTEWTFHPSIPLAFSLLLVQGPLLKRYGRKKSAAVQESHRT